jgi:hypothetical protein
MIRIRDELINEKMSKGQRGQIAIWVIIAILIIASIILLFVLLSERGPTIIPPIGAETFDPQSYIRICTRGEVLNALDIMMPQGGFVETKHSVEYNFTDVEYLCTNLGYYAPCINQHPMLIREMENEIKDYIYDNVSDCINDIPIRMDKLGGSGIVSGPLQIEVDLDYDKALITINKTIQVTKRDSSEEYSSFVIGVITPAYNLAMIANEIASAEARSCNFEPVGYSLNYPRYEVSRYVMSQPTKIYTIKDTQTGKFMYTAIRSCAMPAGM